MHTSWYLYRDKIACWKCRACYDSGRWDTYVKQTPKWAGKPLWFGATICYRCHSVRPCSWQVMRCVHHYTEVLVWDCYHEYCPKVARSFRRFTHRNWPLPPIRIGHTICRRCHGVRWSPTCKCWTTTPWRRYTTTTTITRLGPFKFYNFDYYLL